MRATRGAAGTLVCIAPAVPRGADAAPLAAPGAARLSAPEAARLTALEVASRAELVRRAYLAMGLKAPECPLEP